MIYVPVSSHNLIVLKARSLFERILAPNIGCASVPAMSRLKSKNFTEGFFIAHEINLCLWYWVISLFTLRLQTLLFQTAKFIRLVTPSNKQNTNYYNYNHFWIIDYRSWICWENRTLQNVNCSWKKQITRHYVIPFYPYFLTKSVILESWLKPFTKCE